MLFHILLILILLMLGLALTYNNQKLGNKVYLFIAFAVLYIISTFRSSNIGNDTTEYFYMFQKFGQAINVLELDTTIELGYVLFNKFLYSISPNPMILLAVTSAFVLGTVALFIYKNSPMAWLSIFLFINFRIYYFTLSGIRQSIALAIILISYKFIKERKPIIFSLLIILASFFHASALIFIIVYPLSKINFSKVVMWLYLAVGIFFFITFNYFIDIIFKIFPKYQVYLYSDYFENVRLASFVDFSIIFIIFIFGLMFKFNNLKLAERIKSNSNEEKNILFTIISIAVIVTLIAINASIIKRAAFYFFIFVIIYIPITIKEIKNKKVRILVTYSILVLATLYNIIILVYRPEWQHVYPFEFFWNL